jgi:type VI secretion system protein ImpG
MNSLRFYLNGESTVIHTLYELLSSNCNQIWVRDPTPGSKVKPVLLPPSALKPVGFDEDEGMLPYPGDPSSHTGCYRNTSHFPRSSFPRPDGPRARLGKRIQEPR